MTFPNGDDTFHSDLTAIVFHKVRFIRKRERKYTQIYYNVRLVLPNFSENLNTTVDKTSTSESLSLRQITIFA